MKKPYYDTCPRCGSNLDPGEKCDCALEYSRLCKEIQMLIFSHLGEVNAIMLSSDYTSVLKTGVLAELTDRQELFYIGIRVYELKTPGIIAVGNITFEEEIDASATD